MSLIIIKRSGKLYRFVQLLSTLPIYSSFIKYDYYTEGFVTFRDICTFCRHVLYFTLTTFLIIFATLLVLFLLLVFPFVGLTQGVSFSEPFCMFLGIAGSIFFSYLFLLLLQLTYDWLESRPVKETSDKTSKEPSAIKTTFNIIAKKHNDFCHRLKIDD